MRWRHPPRLMSFKEEQFREPEIGIAPLKPWYKKLVSVGICSGLSGRGRWEGAEGKGGGFQAKTD